MIPLKSPDVDIQKQFG